jgi:deazaflavin-dependent oxidoreductase (nitroreductase family)
VLLVNRCKPLTTTGRRSGKARTTPLTFFRDGTDLVVIASNGGADLHARAAAIGELACFDEA